MVLFGVASAIGLSAFASGCLDRPVSPASPNTTNVTVDQIRQSGVDKIDLLFMIDNSGSMADKQLILQKAVPKLVQRLVTPRCVDRATKAPVSPPANAPNCTGESEAEFPPIKDIHIGVITSSLGAHGGAVCAGGSKHDDDKGRLIGFTRQLPNHENLDFLVWNPDTDPADSADANTLVADFSAQVSATGEEGCGYEASLEAWYRFLIDPQPPHAVRREGDFTVVDKCTQEGADCGTGGVCVGGFCADRTVLAQREQFLRGDSLVAVIMLTDENDCSIRDDGQAWLVGSTSGFIPRASSACSKDPDDPCCTSCALDAPTGCLAHAQDPECLKGGYTKPEDNPNLRCWEQKRRFGLDFLHPLSRYVSGLSSPTVKDRSGAEVPNPLFATGGGVNRDPDLVYLAGIVGVPWQAIATDDSQGATDPLQYKTAREIDWSAITRNGKQAPTNPHMVESNAPRPGLADYNTPNSDPIHGHDWDIAAGSLAGDGPGDLQYACIFPLTTPDECAGGAPNCDCKNVAAKKPLCWDGAQFTTQQRYAKAYPGLRQLEVLRDFGDNAIVASICPKQALDENDPSYGYNPAVDALVDRLKEQLNTKCLTRPLSVTVNKDGSTSTQCAIVEVEVMQPGATCECKPDQNRRVPGEKLIKPVLSGLRTDRICGGAGQPACSQTDFCLCEIGEANPKASCENALNPAGIGWCYIDANATDQAGNPAPIGNPELVKDCNPQRQLRFIGKDEGVPTPKQNSIVFIACLGKPLGG